MAFSYYDYTVSVVPAGNLTFTATIDALRQSHLFVFKNGADVTINSAFSGSTGAWVTTVNSGVGFLPGDVFRVLRVTPNTRTTRVIDFSDASGLKADDLDDSYLQLLYVIQEQIDAISGKFGGGGDGQWNANGRQIRNVGAPTVNTDAARLQDIQGIAISAGNLPTVTTVADYSFITVLSGAWQVVAKATVQTALGLGAAAYKGVGTGGSNVLDQATADTLYARLTQNLLDLPDKAAARTNLGLSGGALLPANDSIGGLCTIHDDGFGNPNLPTVKGRDLDMSGNRVYGADGGHREEAAVVRMTAGQNVLNTASATWHTDAGTKIVLDALSEDMFNTGGFYSGAIAVDTANKRIQLAAGSYRIHVRALFTNTNNASNWAVALACNGTKVIQVADPANGLRLDPDGGAASFGGKEVTYNFFLSPVITANYEFHAACSSGATVGDVKIHTGEIVVVRVR